MIGSKPVSVGLNVCFGEEAKLLQTADLGRHRLFDDLPERPQGGDP